MSGRRPAVPGHANLEAAFAPSAALGPVCCSQSNEHHCPSSCAQTASARFVRATRISLLQALEIQYCLRLRLTSMLF